MDDVIYLLFIIILAVVYFAPGMIASRRQHHNKGTIWVLNLFFGWTLLGWVLVFIWACTPVRKEPDAKT